MAIPDADQLLEKLKELHRQIRNAVVAACERQSVEAMSRIATDDKGDTIYAIDKVSEEVLVEFFGREIAPHWPVVLIGEGLKNGQIVLPHGTKAEDAIIRVIVDPIDGTRMIMYQKRSAWILTGVAPNKGEGTRLRDIELAIQTEIPLLKQHLSDTLWAVAGEPMQAERTNRLTGELQPLQLQPSHAASIVHGFASVAHPLPSGRTDELGSIADAIAQAVVPDPQYGKAYIFQDEYICTAGQLYELIAGHDRFNNDLYPLFYSSLPERTTPSGLKPGACSRPYDLATWLIAEQAGVILTNMDGSPFDAPMTIDGDVGWVGYANPQIRAQVEPILLGELRRRKLI